MESTAGCLSIAVLGMFAALGRGLQSDRSMSALRGVRRPGLTMALVALIPLLALSPRAGADASVNAEDSASAFGDARRFAFVVSDGTTLYGVLGEVGEDWATGDPTDRSRKTDPAAGFFSDVVLRRVHRARLDKELRAWSGRGVDLYVGTAHAGHATAGIPRVLRLSSGDESFVSAMASHARDAEETPASARASKAALRAYVLWHDTEVGTLLAVPLSVDATSPALEGAKQIDACGYTSTPTVWMRDATLAAPLVFSPQPATAQLETEAASRLHALPAWRDNARQKKAFLHEHPDAPKPRSKSPRDWADSMTVQHYRAPGSTRSFVFAVASGTIRGERSCDGDCPDLTLEAWTAWEPNGSGVPVLAEGGAPISELPVLIIGDGSGVQDVVLSRQRLRRTGARLDSREQIQCDSLSDGC